MALNTFNPGDDLLSSEVNENFQKVFNIYFGDGSDGDVTIDSDTTLDSDKQYDNLTIEDGVTLNPNGYKVFVRNKLTYKGTGKIKCNGGDGGNGEPFDEEGWEDDGSDRDNVGPFVGDGGVGGEAPYTSGSLFEVFAGKKGGDGVESSNIGKDGDDGNSVNKSLSGVSGVKGGNGGDANEGGHSEAGGNGGSGGSIGDPIREILNLTSLDITNWIDTYGGTIDIMEGTASSGGGASGGAKDGSWADVAASGGAGGSGANAGMIFVSAFEIETVDGNTYIEAKGGNGGNAADSWSGTDPDANSGDPAAAGGSGGGAGGQGGLVVLIYNKIFGEGVIDVSGGTGGSKGSPASTGSAHGDSGQDGSDGNEGKVIELTVGKN